MSDNNSDYFDEDEYKKSLEHKYNLDIRCEKCEGLLPEGGILIFFKCDNENCPKKIKLN